MAVATVSVELCARVRSLIGEPSTGTWTDTEIYSSLAAAQEDLINCLCDSALFDMSEISETALVAGTNAYDLPDDYVRARLAEYKSIYGKKHPVQWIGALGEGTAAANVHFEPSETNPFWRIHNNKIVWSVGSVTQAASEKYNLWYISSPAADISGTADPELGTELINMLVWFAVSRCYEQRGDFDKAKIMMGYYDECWSLINKRYRAGVPSDGLMGDPAVEFERSGS